MPLTQEEIRDANLLTEDEISRIVDEKTRAIAHAIRQEVAACRLLLDKQEMRITKLEEFYMKNNATMEEVRELLSTMKGGMKFTNALRNAVIWIAGLFVAVAEAFKWWKNGGF